MIRNLTSITAAQVTQGRTTAPWSILKGVSIDSRTIREGDLFFALSGSRCNGSQFLEDAFANGAAAAVVEEGDTSIEQELAYPLLVVKNVEEAMWSLAAYIRGIYKGLVVAVTGSVGKTTTKEYLRTVLVPLCSTYATSGNLNNHLGVPLTLLQLPAHTEAAVIELGMSAAGEIRRLSKLTQPHIVYITEVSMAHSQNFDNEREILLAKLEILEGLAPYNEPLKVFQQRDNIKPAVFLNADSKFFSEALKVCKNKGLNVFSFGSKPTEDSLQEPINFKVIRSNVICSSSEEQPTPTEIKLSVNQEVKAELNCCNSTCLNKVSTKDNAERVEFTLQTLYTPKAALAVGALGLIKFLGPPLKPSIQALSTHKEPNGRGDIKHIYLTDCNREIALTLIDDSYNASPLSMVKSMQSLINLVGSGISTRLIVVLGDMLELSEPENEHDALIPTIQKLKPYAVLTLGEYFARSVKRLTGINLVQSFNSPDALYEKLTSFVLQNDVVFLKGSHGSNVHKVVTLLTRSKA